MTKQEIDFLLERFDQSSKDVQRGIVATLVEDRAALVVCLERLVALQAHYARLLNGYDGCERVPFASAQQWIDRQAELLNIPHKPTVA